MNAPQKDAKPEKRGRSKDDLEEAARHVRVRSSFAMYKASKTTLEEYTYSLENGKYYDAHNKNDRQNLFRKYSDGQSDLYMIAVHNNGNLLDIEQGVHQAQKLVSACKVPFVGRWLDKGTPCEEVSFSVNHGVELKQVVRFLRYYGQKSAMEITSANRLKFIKNPYWKIDRRHLSTLE